MIKSRKNIPIRAVFYVVILIFVMIQVYPIFWVICSSLKTPDEMTYTAQYAIRILSWKLYQRTDDLIHSKIFS